MLPIRYAIIDGAVMKDLMDFLSAHNPPHACLYSEPLQPELVELAPYLLEVTPAVEKWLQWNTSPWGIYLTAKMTMRVLRQHLRKYLQVILPNETKPVIFRFYDPRNIWDFLSVLSDWEKHLFLGDISRIETSYRLQQDVSFKALHERYPATQTIKSKLMSISKEQYSLLEIIFERRYVRELAETMRAVSLPMNKVSIEWASELFNYLRNLGITDRRSIDEIAKLFTRENIFKLSDIPHQYAIVLEGTTHPGHYRAEQLLLNINGVIPAWERSVL
jgi:hypothetical protein